MNEYRPLLADYRALVVDEAHKLPEAASQMDGRSIGREDVQEISYFLNRSIKVRKVRDYRIGLIHFQWKSVRIRPGWEMT